MICILTNEVTVWPFGTFNKTVLPYVADVIAVAIPAFTAKTDDKKNSEIIPEQISELQSAATHNAESVIILAAQLKETIEGIDVAGLNIQQEPLSLKPLCLISILVATVSIVVATLALLSKSTEEYFTIASTLL